MKRLYAAERDMILKVLVYNLFMLFRHEFLRRKKKRQHLKTLRYKYFVLPAQQRSDSGKVILRISSARNWKVRAQLSYPLIRIGSDIPRIDLNCSAVEHT